MNIARLKHILFETTRIKEKPKPVGKTEEILRLFKPPQGSDMVEIDCELMIIEVDPVRAIRYCSELIDILKVFPHQKLLRSGPSYLQIGTMMNQFGKFELEDTLSLFALGEVMSFWTVHTPRHVGAAGDTALKMIEQGHITVTPGFDPNKVLPPQGGGS